MSDLCSVCFMEPEGGSSMTTCGGGHYLCVDCTAGYLSSSISSVSQAMLRQWKESKTLPCPLSTEENKCCVTAGGVFDLKDPNAASLMCDLSASLSSALAQQDAVNRMIQAERSDSATSSKASESKRLVEHIKGRIDDICTSAICCPHCAAPFMDFSGCMALTCGACNKEFCGVCLAVKHAENVKDAHAQVLVCLKKYSPDFLAQYGMRHGDYFISNAGGVNWELWKDRIKASRMLEYLFTIKKDVLWRVYEDVEKHLVANSLMNESEIGQLKNKVFSHEANAQHLVRIPVLFWLLYASKLDCSFRKAMDLGDDLMDQQAKIEVGKLCVAKMREVYPSWQAVRVRVPGESFEAINYPPEALSLITNVIDEWGVRRGFWGGVNVAVAAPIAATAPPTLAPAPAPANLAAGAGQGGRGGAAGRGNGGGYRGRGGRGGRGN